MQALQQDTLLKGGAYKIEKILNQNDFEIEYLSDKFGSDRNVVITEFFMKDICGRDENNSVTYDSDDVATMKDKFKSDAMDRVNHGVIEVFEENNTVYYVKYEGDGALEIVDESKQGTKDTKKPSLASILKWPIIVVAVLGACAYFFTKSEPAPKTDNAVKQKTESVEQKKNKVSTVEKESAAFTAIMSKMEKIKGEANAIPGVSAAKVISDLSNLKDEFEKEKSKLSTVEQEKYHKAFQEILDIIKRRS